MIRLLLLLLLLPAVNAATISDIGLEYNDAPVEYLAPGASFNADFVFKTQGEDLNCEEASCQAVLEFNGEESQFSLSECAFNQSYSCSQEVFIDSLENTYSLLVFSQGLVADKEGVITLTEDNTTPVLAELTTGLCQGETCYVGSNAETPVQARFEDELTAFEQRLVRFDIDGASQHAQHCEGKTCEATVRTSSCVDGSTVKVSVVNFFGSMPSSEDARNAVDNSLTIDAICDATNPVIENFAIRSGGPVPAVYETASPLEVQATITDMPGGAVSLVVESENLTDEEFRSECSETNSGSFVCDAAINNLNQGQHDVTFRFLDGVGNFVEETRNQLLVLESVEQNETDLVDLRVTDITPQPMNRVALQLAMENAIHYPILVDYVLQGDATVVGQSLQNLECVWDEQPLSNESSNRNLFSLERSSILKPNANVNEENRFIFNFHTSAGELPDVVYARCTYDVYVAQDNQFYATPEREDIELTLAFKNSVLGAPGEAFVEEIKRAEAELDGGKAEAIELLTKVGSYADAMCGGFYILSGVDGIATGLQATNWPVIQQIGDVINAPMEMILGSVSDDYRNSKNRKLLWSKANPEGDVGSGNGIGLAMMPTEFTLAGMCEWWTCADAQKSGGFLGAATGGDADNNYQGGLSCGGINDWLARGGEEYEESNRAGGATASASDESAQANDYSEYYDTFSGPIPRQTITPTDEQMRSLLSSESSRNQISGSQQTETVRTLLEPTAFDLSGYDSLTGGNYCAPRYEDSLLTSLGLTGTGFCAKGVISNLGKWHGIDCGYVSCLKEQSTIGANINVCKQAKNFKECTEITGEIFQLPIVNVFTRTSSLVNANVQDIGFNMLNSGLNAYCDPTRTVTEELTNQLIRTALDAATSGGYSAFMEAQALVQKVLGMTKIIKVVDVPKKMTPTTGAPQQFACNLRDSIVRLTDAGRLASGSANFAVQDTTNLCEAARCNGPDCDRGGVSSNYVQQLSELGLLVRAEKGFDQTAESRQAARIRGATYKGYETLYDKTVETTLERHDGVNSNNVLQAVGALTEGNDAGTQFTESGEFVGTTQDLIDLGYTPVEASVALEIYNDVSTIPEDMYFQRVEGPGDEWVVTDGNSYSSVELDPKVVAAFESMDGPGADGVISSKEARQLAQATEECQSCSPEEVVERARNIDVEPTFDANFFENNQKPINTFLELQNSDLSTSEKQARMRQSCSDSNIDCRYTSGNGLEICMDGECKTFSPEEARLVSEKAQAVDNMIAIGIDMVTKWLYDQGYLNNLKLSSWGDWGAETAARADKLWNPDTWATNLCSAEVEVLTDEDPLVGLASTTGPVLTFAAEVRELNETYIYTISYFIRNGDERYHRQNGGGDNKVWLKLDNQDFNWTQNATEGVPLAQGETISGGASFNMSERFEELCVVFDDPFPDNLGNRKFCREIVGDAFER